MEAALAAFLAPFLPYLVAAGRRAADDAAQELGAEAWPYAKALWGRLRPKVEQKPAAQEAVEDVAARPDDEDAHAALRLQLRKLLAEDEQLAADVARLWEQAQAANVTSVTVTASGERAIAVGRDATGTFVTGDAGATDATRE